MCVYVCAREREGVLFTGFLQSYSNNIYYIEIYYFFKYYFFFKQHQQQQPLNENDSRMVGGRVVVWWGVSVGRSCRAAAYNGTCYNG